MIELAALVIGTSFTTLIALVVFLKNSGRAANQLFVGLAFGLVGWSLTTYLSLHTLDNTDTLFWIRLIMIFVVIQNTCFFLLVQVFPARKVAVLKRKRFIVAILYSLLTAGVAISPYLFVDFKNDAPVPGPGMAIFMAHALIFAIGGLAMLLVRYHRARGLEKTQLLYFLAGVLLMFTVVPIGNFVLPLAFKMNQLVEFSPLYAIVFSGLMGYGIVAKRIFDVRFAIARTITFLLLLFTLAAIYAVGVFAVLQLFIDDQQLSLTQNALYIVSAIFLAFTFRPLHQFFSKLTNRIFFQDAYETNVVLDELSDVLVRAVAVEALTRQSLKVLSEALKPQASAIVVLDKENDAALTTTTLPKGSLSVEVFPQLLLGHTQEIFVLDGGISVPHKLYEAMNASHVGVIVRLETSKELLGYIFLGHKAGGSVYTHTDLNLIRIAADELAVALQNALRFKEIQDFNETLQRRIDEATTKLRETNKKLRALDEAKDEFISMASHQMRTPLTSVKGYISMILEGYGGSLKPDQRKLLNEAYNSSQRMVYLIADFLSVSRIRTGKFTIDRKPTRLTDTIQDEINQLEVTAKNRGLALIYQAPSHFPQLMLDEEKTRQVIMNLIDNAIYYTQPGGTVTVTLAATDKEVSFRVQDTGIGVPKSEQHKLFGKFFRATNALKMRPDGTGIGLFLARKIVALQGGAMIFESKEGKGSTFGFRFPRQKLSVDEAVNNPAQQHRQKD